MQSEAFLTRPVSVARSASTANATATATAAAKAGQRHILRGILITIRGGTPTTQDVLIKSAANTQFVVGLAAIAPTVPIFIPIPAGFPCGINEDLSATVPAAGAGVIIEITLFYTTTGA